MNKEPYSSLYKILGFYPDNIHLYEQAFLHKSSSVESGDGRWLNNERLEFLGDAVLDAVVADSEQAGRIPDQHSFQNRTARDDEPCCCRTGTRQDGRVLRQTKFP